MNHEFEAPNFFVSRPDQRPDARQICSGDMATVARMALPLFEGVHLLDQIGTGIEQRQTQPPDSIS
jgi:hypothetical protein